MNLLKIGFVIFVKGAPFLDFVDYRLLNCIPSVIQICIPLFCGIFFQLGSSLIEHCYLSKFNWNTIRIRPQILLTELKTVSYLKIKKWQILGPFSLTTTTTTKTKTNEKAGSAMFALKKWYKKLRLLWGKKANICAWIRERSC